MLRGLLKLTWLEVKIFAREPLGLVGSIAVPVVLFVILGRTLGPRVSTTAPEALRNVRADVPVFGSILIALSAVLSLVTIVSIYRESGILKRLRATPLRPHTILTAHVLVKLLMSALTLAVMFAAGKRYYPVGVHVPVISFTMALLFTTLSILSIGFLIASLVPTARFSQPVASIVFYPMIGLSGLFVPLTALPPGAQTLARLLPLTYAVSLLRGIWSGEGWSAHFGDVVALTLLMVVFTALSAKVFRWE
jgi:ABC-2 type transport system permease protein